MAAMVVIAGFSITQALKSKPIASVDNPAPSRQSLRNGVALSNSLNGYIEDSVNVLQPYIHSGGIRAIRIPLRMKHLIVDGKVADVTMLNGYPTRQTEPLKKLIDLALANNVLVVLDDHEYRAYSHPDVRTFWLALGKWLRNTYGDNENIVLELQNESSQGGWDPNYAASVKTLVRTLRDDGIRYKLAIGWGNWNAVERINRAMSEIDATGGPNQIDPMNRVIWTGHHYPTTTGNDQARAGDIAPKINGDRVSSGVVTFFETCRSRNLKCMVTEIGMGGGAPGWLSNGSDSSNFDGKAWFSEYSDLQAKYAGNVIGTIAWGGGTAWKDTYPFKIRFADDNSDFFRTLRTFWRNEPEFSRPN